MVSRLGEGHMPWTFFLSEPQLKTTVIYVFSNLYEFSTKKGNACNIIISPEGKWKSYFLETILLCILKNILATEKEILEKAYAMQFTHLWNDVPFISLHVKLVAVNTGLKKKKKRRLIARSLQILVSSFFVFGSLGCVIFFMVVFEQQQTAAALAMQSTSTS